MGHGAEPDPDRGDVDGPAPDEVVFVVPGGDGAVLAELAEGPLDGVALLAGGGVEAGRAAAGAAAAQPVADLVGGPRRLSAATSPVARAAKGPSLRRPILKPRKIAVKGAPSVRCFAMPRS
jgi:hypothetical protein